MTNLGKFLGITLLCALFLTLGSCKKDEEVAPRLTIVGDTSLDFEYGQTKQIDYETYRVAEITEITVPKGWSYVSQKGSFTVTSPSTSASSADLSGEVKISARSDNNVTLSRTLKVAVRLAQEITRPANSFIVSEPDTRYKFNARRRGNETAETLTNAARATRVWSTSKTAIINVSYENGYIYFATGAGDTLIEGNAVVAVTDAEDTILWSWHIWATDFDPAEDPHILAGQQVMNRNLGAFACSNASADEAWRSYGLLYQWGRKDPFTGPDAWNSTTPQPLFDNRGLATMHSYIVVGEIDKSDDSEAGTLEYAIAHPDTFIAGDKDAVATYNWLLTRDENLWDTYNPVGTKTIYDPCPAGWKVPTREVFETTLSNDPWATTDPADFNVVGEYRYGWTFVVDDQEIFFPAAGRRSFSKSLASSARNYTNVVNDEDGTGSPVGFYWYSDATNSFAFRNNYIDFTLRVTTPVEQIARAGGFSVRCVSESSTIMKWH